MKTAVYTMNFAKLVQQLPKRAREQVKQAAVTYCATGRAPNLTDLDDHSRFTIDGVTVHFAEDADTVTFTTLHRFAVY